LDVVKLKLPNQIRGNRGQIEDTIQLILITNKDGSLNNPNTNTRVSTISLNSRGMTSKARLALILHVLTSTITLGATSMLVSHTPSKGYARIRQLSILGSLILVLHVQADTLVLHVLHTSNRRNAPAKLRKILEPNLLKVLPKKEYLRKLDVGLNSIALAD
jgi:hypothetical protein